jgi:hypothetical protein
MTANTNKIEEILEAITEILHIDKQEALKILEKVIAGGEITKDIGFEEWFHKRFLPNLVFIDEEGYSRMCVDALKILGSTAATDYGSSRQRDMGQLWADMTRGYLGELAFLLLLEKRWKIEAILGHEVGSLEDFLPMDIHHIKKPGESYRGPQLNLSIKTTKWNGIWLDIPGDQFAHSDVHILVKVGAGRDHLFAFFKKISVFKDKVLKIGEKVGSLTSEEAQALFDSLPSFKPIPAYICGFVPKGSEYARLSYTGKKGSKNYNISSWNGPIHSGDLEKIRENEHVTGKVSFDGIGSFAHDSGYLFNTGNLLWRDMDWNYVIENI